MLANLHGKFARRHQNKRLDAARVAGCQPLDDRHQEGKGLAGSRLRRGQYVLACERLWNRGGLDGCGD